MKKILFLSLLIFSLGFSFSGGVADQPDFPNIYIDEGCAGTYVGSEANPYDDLSDINWTTGGDNSIFDYLAGSPSASPTIHLNKGDTWTARMTAGCSGTATYPIVVDSYGSGAKPIIDMVGDIPNWGTSGNWTVEAGGELVTDGGFAAVTTTGSELVTNGNMEADANWVDYQVPTTQSQSGVQKHGGSYSRYLESGASGNGIKLHDDDNFTVTNGKRYLYDWWVYPDTSTSHDWEVKDGGGGSLVYATHTGLSQGSWNNVKKYLIEDTGGAFGNVVMAGKFDNDYYFDDVSYKEITFTSWTMGAGWWPDISANALTNKAIKVAGSASNLDQSGLAAEAGEYYKVVWTVSGRTAGAIQMEFGSTSGSSQNTNATFTEYVVATDTDYLKLKADSSFDGIVDDVSVKKINVWYIQSIAIDPERVWIDGTEYMQAETDQTNIDVTHRWWYDSGNNYLYIYCVGGNPADQFTTLKGSNTGDGTTSQAIRIQNFSYITFQNLDLRGGEFCVTVESITANVTGIIFDECNIGYNSGDKGIQVQTTSDSYDVTSGQIKNCTFDSNSSLSYDWDIATADEDNPGYAIVLDDGSQDWLVHDNTMLDWHHSAILIDSSSANRDTTGNEIYDNTITFSNIDLGRGVAMTGLSANNKFYRNLIQDSKLFNNFGGDSNEFTHNIVDTVTNPSWDATGKAYGIVVRPISTTCTSNQVYNNVFYNTEEPAILVSDAGLAVTVDDNEIINNILMNNTTSSNAGFTAGIALSIDSTIAGNVYKNNIMYQSGITDYVDYRGTDKTITEFNAENGNDSNTISENQAGDPLMTDPVSDDFTLQVGSPCIDAGVDVGLTEDYAGDRVKVGQHPDIGAYEFQTNIQNINLEANLEVLLEVNLDAQTIQHRSPRRH